MSRCSRCRRVTRYVGRWPLPLTGEIRALCPKCLPVVFLGHMRSLLVPHG